MNMIDVYFILIFGLIMALFVVAYFISWLYRLYLDGKTAALPLFSILKARPYRNLKENEIEVLKKYIDTHQHSNYRQARGLAMVLMLITVFPLILLYMYIFPQPTSMPADAEFIDLNYFLRMSLFVFGIAGAVVFTFWRTQQEKYRYAGDLKSPIFMLQHYLSLSQGSLGKSTKTKFRVGKYEFDSQYMRNGNSFEGLKDGHSVNVLFSPRTRYVWEISKL